MASRVQSLIFDRARWSGEAARAWAKSHGFAHGTVDEQPNTLRLRQFDPPAGQYRTIPFGTDSGIQAVIAFGGAAPARTYRIRLVVDGQEHERLRRHASLQDAYQDARIIAGREFPTSRVRIHVAQAGGTGFGEYDPEADPDLQPDSPELDEVCPTCDDADDEDSDRLLRASQVSRFLANIQPWLIQARDWLLPGGRLSAATTIELQQAAQQAGMPTTEDLVYFRDLLEEEGGWGAVFGLARLAVQSRWQRQPRQPAGSTQSGKSGAQSGKSGAQSGKSGGGGGGGGAEGAYEFHNFRKGPPAYNLNPAGTPRRFRVMAAVPDTNDDPPHGDNATYVIGAIPRDPFAGCPCQPDAPIAGYDEFGREIPDDGRFSGLADALSTIIFPEGGKNVGASLQKVLAPKQYEAAQAEARKSGTSKEQRKRAPKDVLQSAWQKLVGTDGKDGEGTSVFQRALGIASPQQLLSLIPTPGIRQDTGSWLNPSRWPDRALRTMWAQAKQQALTAALQPVKAQEALGAVMSSVAATAAVLQTVPSGADRDALASQLQQIASGLFADAQMADGSPVTDYNPGQLPVLGGSNPKLVAYVATVYGVRFTATAAAFAGLVQGAAAQMAARARDLASTATRESSVLHRVSQAVTSNVGLGAIAGVGLLGVGGLYLLMRKGKKRA